MVSHHNPANWGPSWNMQPKPVIGELTPQDAQLLQNIAHMASERSREPGDMWDRGAKLVDALSRSSVSPDVAGLIEAARHLMPYLKWTIGPESCGHHPTMPSVVDAFEAALSRLDARLDDYPFDTKPSDAAEDGGEPKQDDARDSTVGVEPDYWAVESKSGSHVGLWPDKADAQAAMGDYYDSIIMPLYTAASLASARADGIREGLERAVKVAKGVGAFDGYSRDELTQNYGQPRFDLMNEIIAAIRALINKDAGGPDAH